MQIAQEKLEGIAPEIPSIENAAKEYVTVRNTRMEWTKKEVEAQAALLAAMKEANIRTYRTVDGHDCVLDTKEKVKVKGAKEEGEE